MVHQMEMSLENKIQPDKHGTDNEAVLYWLLEGERLTSSRAQALVGTTRLSARIFNLKEDGWDIKDRTVQVSKRGGRRANISEYWLEV